MKPALFKAFLSGIILSFLVLSSSMICLFRSGVSAVIDTALLSIGLLALLRGMNSVNVALSDIFARAFISGASTASLYLIVLVLNGNTISNRLYIYFALVMIVSAGAGILFFANIGHIFIGQKYPYPQLKPRLQILAAPTQDTRKNRKLVAATVFSAGYTLFCKHFSLQEFRLSNLSIPVFSNSLLYVSSGYFIGYRTWLKMLIGFFYSATIFILFPAQSFSDHILNPYIYSVVLAFSLTNGGYAIMEAIQNIRVPLSTPHRWRKKLNAIMILVCLAIFYKLLFQLEPTLTDLSFFLLFLSIVATIISSTSTAIGVAETGFWFSILDDILPIILIAFTQMQDISSIILLLAGFTSFEMAGIYYTINSRVGERFAISKRIVTAASILSCTVSSIFAIMLVRVLSMGYSLGGSEYPVPNAKVLDMTIRSLILAFTEFTVPSYLNLYVFFAAVVLCILFKKKQISPMNIISGILLPFGAFLSLGVGALFSYTMRDNKDRQIELFSGFSIGEGIVSTALAFLYGI